MKLISIHLNIGDDTAYKLGFKKGIAMGRATAFRKVAMNLDKIGFDTEFITGVTGLTSQELENLK